jgi:hypothetical protein
MNINLLIIIKKGARLTASPAVKCKALYIQSLYTGQGLSHLVPSCDSDVIAMLHVSDLHVPVYRAAYQEVLTILLIMLLLCYYTMLKGTESRLTGTSAHRAQFSVLTAQQES